MNTTVERPTTPDTGSAAELPSPALPRTFSRRRRRWFTALVGIGVVQAAATLGIAALVERSFSLLLERGAPLSGRVGTFLLIGLAGAVVVAGWTRWAERVAAETVGQDYVVEVRDRLFTHLTGVPPRHLATRHRGSMLLKFVGDVDALRKWVSLGLARLLVAGTACTVAVVGVPVVDPGLGLALGSALALGAGLTVLLTRKLLRATRTARRRRARLTGEVTERLTHIGVVQAAGQERRERRRVGRRSDAVADAMLEAARRSGAVRAVAESTGVLATAAVLVAGAVRVADGAVSPATVVAVMSVTGMLAAHLRDLGRVSEYAAGASVARAAARRFLAIPRLPDPADAPELVPTSGELRLEGVGVEGSLVDVHAHVPAGSTVAVVGPNGAGKSTLVSVLARLTPPDAGRVLLDGQDLALCSVRSVRDAVGVASPDLPLLRGSLSRNVRYRSPRASEEELARVVALTGLDDVVDAVPGGWSAEVGDGGASLSAGQRSRAAIARAALGDPAVLVLDEAEAHLDREASLVVERVVSARAATTLVVTHRREIAERADLVWFLDAGRLVEVGTPAELFGTNSRTARLFTGNA